MNNVLEVENLCKAYGNFSLKKVNFSLPENCITGFIGVNGAGKSTTIRNILGLALPNTGSIKFFGKSMDTDGEIIKNRVGIVLDDGAFYENLSMQTMKNILAPAYFQWNENDYKKYMREFNLDPKQKISTLSKGMKIKFALTIALSHNADLLIMDEPTSGLDPLIRSELMGILLDFVKSESKSVFFSTHITSDLEKIADMLVLIDKGQIVFQEEKDLLLEKYRTVKGDLSDLSEEMRKIFLTVQTNNYGFIGITEKTDMVKKACRKQIIIEKPSIEDIMLAHIGGVN
ncbi:ABC transporter ATP-binding protein [Aminipila sp.]|uniref:ABC transporter ATP-binding protein n=1 Tax=Aminipila sp. TaxID=2060095 RepID=UPI00289FB5E1|nr:ABC transporter ATP-binding protein [Aminipila sp.]